MAEIITIRENGFRSSQWRVCIPEANRLFWPVGVCMKMKGTKYLHFHVSCKLKTDAALRVACSTIVIQCNTRIFTRQLGFALRHLVLIGSVSQRDKKVDPGVICTFQYRFTPYSNLHKKNYAGPCCKQQASLFPADTTARRKEKSGHNCWLLLAPQFLPVLLPFEHGPDGGCGRNPPSLQSLPAAGLQQMGLGAGVLSE